MLGWSRVHCRESVRPAQLCSAGKYAVINTAPARSQLGARVQSLDWMSLAVQLEAYSGDLTSIVTSLASIMSGPDDAELAAPRATFVTFNQDTTCVAVGTPEGYSLYSLNSTDALDPVYKSEEPDVFIAERLFSSSLVAVVAAASPRTLRIEHFKKGTEICRYSYGDRVRAVRMNRARLVVCLEESLYIHNIRDMKVIHTIRDTPPNPSGLLALSTDSSNCYLAYPGHSHTGELQIFDCLNLASRVIIPAHEGQLAALQFSPSGQRIATASVKGTVIRVFSCHDGAKLYELRRGLKRTASIYSLSFSPCGSFLACSSNTETVHVFRLDEGMASDNHVLAGSPPQDDGWFGYINTAITASSAYLPTTVTETLLQGRAFASVHLTQTGNRTICALAMIRRSLRLLVCSSDGYLHLYSLDQAEGGDCSLIRQFLLGEELVVPGLVSEVGEEEERPDYSETVKNRNKGEMTADSERFHEMSSASESPPKTAFLLDDDGEFPPVAFAAS